MAIPGMTPKLEVRAKVKTGEVRTSNTNGRTYPASTDYFICEDAEFQRLYPGKPNTLRITPAFADPEEFFSTGMEWWTKQRSGANHLACYTKDSGDKPVALRSKGYMDEGLTVLGAERGNQRIPILCPFRECSHFNERNGCKPMGRLTFFLFGEPWETSGQGPLELSTKGWNSIEALTGVLGRYPSVAGKVFDLSVAFEQRGTDRFPLLSIQEADLLIETDADIETADTILALAKAFEKGQFREGLIAYLDATQDGWRQNDAYIERIKAVGAEQAVKTILDRELRR
jgi:hypothetical protein